jgi:hypothetical protein
MIRYVFPFVAFAVLTACADAGTYPSLAKRPFETGQPASPLLPPQQALPSDPALRDRVVNQVRKAEAGVSDFNAALAPAQTAARNAGAENSESWIEAQMAVSRLERTLFAARDALAALDDERRVATSDNPGDRAAIEAAIATVEAIDARQSAEIEKLAEAINRR